MGGAHLSFTSLKDFDRDPEWSFERCEGSSGFECEKPVWEWVTFIQKQRSEKRMIHKSMALGAIAALALSAQAQTFNWMLTASGSYGPGNGSGQLTLSSGVVTAMSGTVGGNSITLIPVNAFGNNDNKLPLDSSGLAFSISNYGNFKVVGLLGGMTFFDNGIDGGPAGFSYTAVPEPSTWAVAGVFGVAAVVTVGVRRRQAAKA